MTAAFRFHMALGPATGGASVPARFGPGAEPLHRRQIMDKIEALIGALDELDVDPDMEPIGDEEPDLGWAEGRSDVRQSHDDGEVDAGDECEHDADAEPSLGWTSTMAIGVLGINRTRDGDLRPMVKALGLLPLLNTPEDEERRAAGQYVLRRWGAYQKECSRRRGLRTRRS